MYMHTVIGYVLYHCDCTLFSTVLSSDIHSLVREIVKKEPLISEHREQQVWTLIKSLCYCFSACGILVQFTFFSLHRAPAEASRASHWKVLLVQGEHFSMSAVLYGPLPWSLSWLLLPARSWGLIFFLLQMWHLTSLAHASLLGVTTGHARCGTQHLAKSCWPWRGIAMWCMP